MRLLLFALLLQMQVFTAEVWFIINPASGTGQHGQTEKLISKKIRKNHKIFYTSGPKDATRLAKMAVAKEVPIVAVIGGDGTIHEVANGLIGSKTALAIIPCGSGNGLARHLGIPLDTKKALDLINDPTNQISIDTIQVNDQSYINVAGVGFDADIGDLFSKEKKRGFISYISHVLKELPNYKPQEYELIIDNKTIKRTAFLISFANSSQWGNNACIAPKAKIDDGFMDVAILKEFPLYSTPYLALQLFTKSLNNSKYVEMIKAKKVILKKAGPAHMDGEPTTLKEKTKIEVHPKSLKVIIP